MLDAATGRLMDHTPEEIAFDVVNVFIEPRRIQEFGAADATVSVGAALGLDRGNLIVRREWLADAVVHSVVSRADVDDTVVSCDGTARV